MPPAELAITHIANSLPPAFVLTRHPETKSAGAVPIPSPYEFPLEGQPNSNLMHELRWYLEHFLDYPFPPETTRAGRILDALKAWGTSAFNALFDRRDAHAWPAAANILQIRSDDPHILSWPWEALYDPQATYLAHHRSRNHRHRHRRHSDSSDPLQG
jgi:hypothetical protein